MAAAQRPDGPDQLLQQVARRLYALAPEEFTAARTAAVKQARGDGDRALAREVGALRRPALAAWAVNLLVRERADLVEEVTSMGDSLRQAQSQLDGAALRDLNRQRRRLVAAVTAEVAAVAAEHDHALSAAASRQVEETVQAALVDPRAAAAVRTGLLVQPLTSTGVESLAEVLGVPLPEGAGSASRSEGSSAGPTAEEPARPALSLVTEDEQEARRAAQQRAAAAEKAARKAAKARDKAVAARAKAQARVLQAEAAVEELRGRLAEAEGQAEEAVARLAAREAAVESAETAASQAAAEAAAASRASRPS